MLNKLVVYIRKIASSWFKSKVCYPLDKATAGDLSDDPYWRHHSVYLGRIERVEVLQDGARIVHFEGEALVEEQLERLRKNGLAMSTEKLGQLIDESISRVE